MKATLKIQIENNNENVKRLKKIIRSLIRKNPEKGGIYESISENKSFFKLNGELLQFKGKMEHLQSLLYLMGNYEIITYESLWYDATGEMFYKINVLQEFYSFLSNEKSYTHFESVKKFLILPESEAKEKIKDFIFDIIKKEHKEYKEYPRKAKMIERYLNVFFDMDNMAYNIEKEFNKYKY